MKKNAISAPCAYVLTWFVLVGAVFAYSMEGCWEYLFAADPAGPAGAARPAATKCPPADSPPLPRLDELLPPATLATRYLPPDTAPAQPPGGAVTTRASGATGKAVVSNPRFETSGTAFTAHFDLGIPVTQSHTSWQAKPAAWMVDIPGQWQRQGREEYQIRHDLVRKARIMLYKDKLRLKFYFTQRTRKPGPLPVVDFSQNGISVSIGEAGR